MTKLSHKVIKYMDGSNVCFVPIYTKDGGIKLITELLNSAREVHIITHKENLSLTHLGEK